jgi:hypothetical protein
VQEVEGVLIQFLSLHFKAFDEHDLQCYQLSDCEDGGEEK